LVHTISFLSTLHISCLTTYHPTFSIQSPPFHYCPTTPHHINPNHADPKLPCLT
jgi:hypothetical protein